MASNFELLEFGRKASMIYRVYNTIPTLCLFFIEEMGSRTFYIHMKVLLYSIG